MAAGPSPIVQPSRARTAAHPGRTAGAPVVEEVVEEHVTPPAPPRGRKVVEVYEDDDDEDDGDVGPDGYRTVVVKHPKRSMQAPPPRQTGKRWFGGRF